MTKRDSIVGAEVGTVVLWEFCQFADTYVSRLIICYVSTCTWQSDYQPIHYLSNRCRWRCHCIAFIFPSFLVVILVLKMLHTWYLLKMHTCTALYWRDTKSAQLSHSKFYFTFMMQVWLMNSCMVSSLTIDSTLITKLELDYGHSSAHCNCLCVTSYFIK